MPESVQQALKQSLRETETARNEYEKPVGRSGEGETKLINAQMRCFTRRCDGEDCSPPAQQLPTAQLLFKIEIKYSESKYKE